MIVNFIEQIQQTYKENRDYYIKTLQNKNFINESFRTDDDYILPGKSLQFLINIDDLTFTLLQNTGVKYEVPEEPTSLDYLFQDLDKVLLEEDRIVYMNAIDVTFKKHLALFNEKDPFLFRSSFVFRVKRENERITSYLQHNIPIKIEDGRIRQFFSVVTDISHSLIEQNNRISFYNMKDKEEYHYELKDKLHEGKIPQLHLSNRELEILQFVIQGLNTKDMAKALDISVETVNRHRKNMIKKNNKKNIIHLATEAFKQNLI
ncbi:helix-turn-helix domain-containing protein [Flammeovirga aprica]|uniref:Helix-turn-helix transcriptional regulator n=1 Tax=Flammeovirga aprica JL-4 TaxID=694437 RepID=A0A7X9P0Z2_9BACT|nr:helix-turn-helix transcriptional regulator [Flammeovirga aprica]NME67435.1 helix-turn-helix transcriptional regulator [Flammeovirga aprica JL-4]